jgi:hypothetical protein
MELLEQKLKNQELELTHKDQELLRLKKVLDEPDPMINRSRGGNTEKSASEILEELSPAEVMMLAKKHGLTIAQIFPT